MTQELKPVDGTMVRGADGALYFIPDQKLEAFRIPDEQAAPVNQALDTRREVQGYSFLAQPLTPEVQIVSAFKGPLGLRPNCDNEPTEVNPRAFSFLSR
jgi:hypothetical protein